jgi:hypothetical protein
MEPGAPVALSTGWYDFICILKNGVVDLIDSDDRQWITRGTPLMLSSC